MTEPMREIDTVLAELDRESRLKQRRATWFLVVLIGVGLTLLGSVLYRTQRAYVELSDITHRVERLRAEKATLEKENKGLSGAVKSLDIIGQAVAPHTTGLPVPPSALPTRVYIHIAREDQRDKARELSRALFAKNVVAPGIELVPKPPTNTVVKYFREGEKTIAEDVLASLQTVGIAKAKVDLIRGFEDRVRPKHLEVWFGSAE